MEKKKMKQQLGRSMIEIVGVLTIGIVMIAAAYNMYKSIDQRQKRLIMSETIEDVAKKIKVLYEFSGTGYKNVSLTNLINKGAIPETWETTPPFGTDFDVSYEKNEVLDVEGFVITIEGLTPDDCKYFQIKKADWATYVLPTVNINKTCTVKFFAN